MNVILCLLLSYCMCIDLWLTVAFIFANNMDRNSNGSINHPNNGQRIFLPEDIIASLRAAEEELMRQERAARTPAPRLLLNENPQRFNSSHIVNSGHVSRSPSIVSETHSTEYDSTGDVYDQHHVPLPRMHTPRFDESSYVERPHCPVPNDVIFMPPHVFNQQLFPNPADAYADYLRRPQSANPSTGQRPRSGARPFTTGSPGPSHSRNLEENSSRSRSSPLDLTATQKAILRREFIEAGRIFSNIARALAPRYNERATGTSSPINTRPGSVSPFIAEPSNVGPCNARPSTVGPFNTRPATAGPCTATSPNVSSFHTGPANVGPINAGPSKAEPSNVNPSGFQGPAYKVACNNAHEPIPVSLPCVVTVHPKPIVAARNQGDATDNAGNPKPNLKRKNSDADN